MAHPTSQNLSLWKNGTPINEARLRFASDELTAKLKQNPKPSLSGTMSTLIERSNLTNTEALQVMASATTIYNQKCADHLAVLLEINQNFLRLIRSKEVRCFGFEFPRSVASYPVEMLPEYWDFHPNWEKGEYRQAGLHLIELRVIAVGTPNEVEVAPPTSAVGRPSVRPEILSAMQNLQDRGTFILKPLNANFAPIRQWIKENRPTSLAAIEGVGDGVISKVIRAKLADDKNRMLDKL